MIKIVFDNPEFGDNWIEFKERGWTRPDLRRLEETEDGNELLTLLHSKATACRIETIDDEIITDPTQIDEDLLDRLDLALVDFPGAAVVRAAGEIRGLGFTNAVVSSNGNGTAA